MYNAIVCKIHTRPHPNADNLILGDAHGYQVCVSKDTEDGQLGIFFGADGQLSEQFCAAHDLIGYTDPETLEKKGGYFPKNRRVRAQSFRGEKSEGFWCPISYLDFCGIDTSGLQEGYTFTEWNGTQICNKYFTPATLKAQQNGKKIRENKYFAKHVDTEQLKHVENFGPFAIIYITEKLHGTSGRYGKVIVETKKKKKLRHKLLRLNPGVNKSYESVLGTRNVILESPTHVGFHGSESFRFTSVEGLENQLHQGEVIYFELVGFTPSGQTIMSTHDIKKMKDKKIQKQFGDTMTYAYGNGPEQCSLYVYRITQVNEEGQVFELPWPQVKKRCKELNISHVPELGTYLFQGEMDKMRYVAEALSEGTSVLDESHIREGVVLRVESQDGETSFFKYKGFVFSVLEGIKKESDDYVDLEEVS